MSVFLDANILFSAANHTSNLYDFLHWLKDREDLVTSVYASEEALKNLQLKRPQWISGYHNVMRFVALVQDAYNLTDTIKLVDKDRPILASAIDAKCAYLITGDRKDFGHLYNKTIEGVMIVDRLTLTKIMLAKYS